MNSFGLKHKSSPNLTFNSLRSNSKYEFPLNLPTQNTKDKIKHKEGSYNDERNKVDPVE